MLNPENQLIRLQAVDPARNIARQYEILVQRDFFGALTVDYSWGRIGTAGQSRRVSFVDADRGERFVRQILARRKTANARSVSPIAASNACEAPPFERSPDTASAQPGPVQPTFSEIGTTSDHRGG